MKNRIGIVGGGQLGRMMTTAAKKLGFSVTILDPQPKSPAGQVADKQIVSDYNDPKALKELERLSDVITVEVEVTDEDGLHGLLEKISKNGTPVEPSPKSFKIVQDKLKQKQFLKKFNIPTADFTEIFDKDDVLKAAEKFGCPFLLKARTGAYDGKGNALIRNPDEIGKGLEKLKNRKLYAERYVDFTKELAVMVARNTKGDVKVFPVTETIHKNNICHLVFVPAAINEKFQKKAISLAKQVVNNLKGAGCFGIEMFLTNSGQVLINEIAPRVHNSGHYTIESCVTSQFEQHIRAITGLPLGETTLVTPAAVMINILGERIGDVKVSGLEKALKLKNVNVHIYGKIETRIERKMGHITVIDQTLEKAYKKAILARKYISI